MKIKNNEKYKNSKARLKTYAVQVNNVFEIKERQKERRKERSKERKKKDRKKGREKERKKEKILQHSVLFFFRIKNYEANV